MKSKSETNNVTQTLDKVLVGKKNKLKNKCFQCRLISGKINKIKQIRIK